MNGISSVRIPLVLMMVLGWHPNLVVYSSVAHYSSKWEPSLLSNSTLPSFYIVEYKILSFSLITFDKRKGTSLCLFAFGLHICWSRVTITVDQLVHSASHAPSNVLNAKQSQFHKGSSNDLFTNYWFRSSGHRSQTDRIQSEHSS